jgi:hypothetical protein
MQRGLPQRSAAAIHLVEYFVASTSEALLYHTFRLANAFLRTTDATGDGADACSTLCRIRFSVDNGTNGTTDNGTANRAPGNFFARAHFISIGLALCLVGVISTHINPFTVDNRLIDKWATTGAPSSPETDSQH